MAAAEVTHDARRPDGRYMFKDRKLRVQCFGNLHSGIATILIPTPVGDRSRAYEGHPEDPPLHRWNADEK
jgi:hypothetical protein